MDSSWKKPSARMVKPTRAPAPSSEEASDARDEMETQVAVQNRALQQQKADDKIGAHIGSNWFITNWTHPILAHPVMPQMSVTRFYPEIFTAVDIFTVIGPWEARQIDIKRAAFKNNMVQHGGRTGKVRYGALSYADPLSALLPQLEI